MYLGNCALILSGCANRCVSPHPSALSCEWNDDALYVMYTYGASMSVLRTEHGDIVALLHGPQDLVSGSLHAGMYFPVICTPEPV